MYTALVIVTTIQFVGLAGLAILVIAKSKQLKQTNRMLSDCQVSLGSYSQIEDAEKHLKSCQKELEQTVNKAEQLRQEQERQSVLHQGKLEKLKVEARDCSEEIDGLKQGKQKLEKVITQYQAAVGDFKSVSKLQERQRELQKLVGNYEQAADLQIKIEQQQSELQQCAKAMQVSANAKEILSKVAYYENLIAQLKTEVESIEETLDLQQFGVYRPQYNFEHSQEYKATLDAAVDQRKQMIKAKQAVIIPPGITVAGDERAGMKLGEEYAKVMLRAFNGEVDSAITKAKYNNMKMLQERIKKSREKINRLGDTMQIAISEEYLEVRLEELRSAYELERKKQQEREQQAYLKEQAREEERARKEAAKAEKAAAMAEKQEQERLEEKERMLAELRKELEDSQLDLADRSALSRKEQERLESQLSEKQKRVTDLETQRETLIIAVKEAHERRERAISLAEQTKRGYVYILSNIGSFGEGWFKIGMTRREDPNVRVRELASASVPFPFDIHAMVLCDNAPELENKLHTYFGDRRVNKVNSRKEFFAVTIEEIHAAIEQIYSSPIEFRPVIEAAEYRQTQAIVREEQSKPQVGRLAAVKSGERGL